MAGSSNTWREAAQTQAEHAKRGQRGGNTAPPRRPECNRNVKFKKWSQTLITTNNKKSPKHIFSSVSSGLSRFTLSTPVSAIRRQAGRGLERTRAASEQLGSPVPLICLLSLSDKLSSHKMTLQRSYDLSGPGWLSSADCGKVDEEWCTLTSPADLSIGDINLFILRGCRLCRTAAPAVTTGKQSALCGGNTHGLQYVQSLALRRSINTRGVLNKNIQHGAAYKYNMTPYFPLRSLSTLDKEEKSKHDAIQHRRPERFLLFLMKRNICKGAS